jgi:hypothetical protein
MYFADVLLFDEQQGDRNLSEISHIIVDEVHERTVLVHFRTRHKVALYDMNALSCKQLDSCLWMHVLARVCDRSRAGILIDWCICLFAGWFSISHFEGSFGEKTREWFSFEAYTDVGFWTVSFRSFFLLVSDTVAEISS